MEPHNTSVEPCNVDQSESNKTLSENQSNMPTQRKGRRGTRLKDVPLGRSNGQKISIQFDRYWQPIGPNATKYISFISLLARSKASILVEEWKNISVTVKDNIWDTIQLTYNVPQSKVLRKKTISYCSTRWRSFKTQLAREYLYNKKVKDATPCSKYAFIDENTWQEFRKIRTSQQALEKRVKAIENGSKNDCPQTMSRGGYAKAEKDLMEAKRKRLEEQSQSDPTIILSPPSPVRREDRWMYAHKTRSGSYTSEHARKIAENIEVLQQQQVEGSFNTEGRNDILTVATGKPDYPGRVRGVGRNIGLKDYFGPRSRHSSSVVSRDEVEALLATVKAEARAEAEPSLDARLEAQLEARLDDRLRKMKEEMMCMMSSREVPSAPKLHEPTDFPSTKGSCSIIGHTSKVGNIQNGEPCDLYLEDPSKRLVARGSVYNFGTTVHHREILDDQVRVVVEEVIIADAPVPIPINEEISTVGEAIKTFVLWPKRLVNMVRAKVTSSNQPVPQPHLLSQPQPQLNALQQVVLMSYDKSFELKSLLMDPGVVGKPGITVYIDKNDLVALVAPNQQVTIANIQVFMMYMHRKLLSSKALDKFGFICPIHMHEKGNNASLRHEYLSRRICEDKIECFLAPYYHDYHWQLVLLSVKSNRVIFLCSIHKQPGKELKKTIDLAMRTYQVTILQKHSHEVKGTQWITPKSRRQPMGTNLCGFYVLRHMFNIISKGITELTQEMFDRVDPFAEGEIDYIRECWSEFFIDLLQQ